MDPLLLFSTLPQSVSLSLSLSHLHLNPVSSLTVITISETMDTPFHKLSFPLVSLLIITLSLPTKTSSSTSSNYHIECTMCSSCNNPCGQNPPPKQPQQSYPPPPPSGGGTSYYYPPPSQPIYYVPPPYKGGGVGGGGGGAYFPPPTYGQYPGPPPPDPIVPYFPFFYHSPPSANGSSDMRNSCGVVYALGVLYLALALFLF